MANLKKAYDLVAAMASPTHDEGLKKPRAVLLLWFLRNVVGFDDLDAYEYICDGDDDQGIDGAFLEWRGADDEQDTLVLLQSKYPQGPTDVGPGEIAQFVGRASVFESLDGLDGFLKSKLQPELRKLIERLEVRRRLQEGQLQCRLIFVTAGVLNGDAQKLIAATNAQRGAQYITEYDLRKLAPIIQAVTKPTTVKATVVIKCAHDERFVVETAGRRIAVCAVRASEIVTWPGIDDRSLFDLNVRHELRPNRVRRQLDSAIKKAADHPNFLAFHNGMTVVCDELDATDPTTLTVKNMSVVNGTQSAVALKMNEHAVTDELRLVVKFVELGAEHPVAREVARRSNTQNPVNPRNLRALDGRQLALKDDLEARYSGFTYETRPDYTNPSVGYVIPNDKAAQLLAAFYNEKPWVAVKRLSLFEGDQYTAIFNQDISADHIVFVERVHQRVSASKASFPEEYQRSWQLTALVAVYLIGQMVNADDDLSVLRKDPAKALQDPELDNHIDILVKNAAAALNVRHDEIKQAGEFDDFKVDFKREGALRELAKSARKHYLYFKTMGQT